MKGVIHMEHEPLNHKPLSKKITDRAIYYDLDLY